MKSLEQKIDAFITSTEKKFDQLFNHNKEVDDRFNRLEFMIKDTKRELKEDIAEVVRQGKKTYELVEIVATQTKAHDSKIVAKHQNYTELEERVYKLEQAAHVS